MRNHSILKRGACSIISIMIAFFGISFSASANVSVMSDMTAYHQWLTAQSKVNTLDVTAIPIEGEMVTVRYRSSQADSIVIKDRESKEETVSVPLMRFDESAVDRKHFYGRLGEINRLAATDIILPRGEYEVELVEGYRVITEPVDISTTELFLVAMGDAKSGYTFQSGAVEPIQHDDRFNGGFYVDGKLAYYLKGKIKGKYFITSSLDTERKQKELFRSIDPDKYYPVYGDNSTINYDATNTQGALYFLLEWDSSSVVWGNYTTGLTGSEFAQFNRSLYGGRVQYEQVSTTKFGEPTTKVIGFYAHAKQRAAHNEFLGTGGSLYYLKHRDVIEGSEHVSLEVRDSITGLVESTQIMKDEKDYDIDYGQGRILFWQPVHHVTGNDNLISTALLQGNPIYVVVDYEYEVKDKYDESTSGGRVEQSITDYVRLGATYVSEEQGDTNYLLQETDLLLHFGDALTVRGEYAESESEALEQFVSIDGGLSFTSLSTGDTDKGKAYGVSATLDLFEKGYLSVYYKRIDKGFSSVSTIAHQGKKTIGGQLRYALNDRTFITARYDVQKLLADGNLHTQLQVGAKEVETASITLRHERSDRLTLTAEYRHQAVTDALDQFESETNEDDDIIAVRADYKINDTLAFSLGQQVTVAGERATHTTAGVQAAINEYLTIAAEEMIGSDGAATRLGATITAQDRVSLAGDYTMAHGSDRFGDRASLGGIVQVDEKTELSTQYAVRETSSGRMETVTVGAAEEVDDDTTVHTERVFARRGDFFSEENRMRVVRDFDGGTLTSSFSMRDARTDEEISNTNIFGLEGTINDRWALAASFESGDVEDYDGTEYNRNAGSLGCAYARRDPATDEVIFKASSKFDIRLDEGTEDKEHYLLYNALERVLNKNTTFFAETHFSKNKNTTLSTTDASYKEITLGCAHRPVMSDRLNLLGKYTYYNGELPSGQVDSADIEEQKTHTFAIESVFDLTSKWQLVDKVAYKRGEEKVTGFDFTEAETWLFLHRFNYAFTENWSGSAEYRYLAQQEAKDAKHGALVELTRRFGDTLMVGLGYNFTDFNDDLTHLDYTAHGPYVRMTASLDERIFTKTPLLRHWLDE